MIECSHDLLQELLTEEDQKLLKLEDCGKSMRNYKYKAC